MASSSSGHRRRISSMRTIRQVDEERQYHQQQQPQHQHHQHYQIRTSEHNHSNNQNNNNKNNNNNNNNIRLRASSSMAEMRRGSATALDEGDYISRMSKQRVFLDSC